MVYFIYCHTSAMPLHYDKHWIKVYSTYDIVNTANAPSLELFELLFAVRFPTVLENYCAILRNGILKMHITFPGEKKTWTECQKKTGDIRKY